MELTDRNFASLFMNGATIFILIGIMINTSMYRRRGRADDKLFFAMLITDILIAVTDSLVAVANKKSFSGAELMNIISYSLFYILEAVFAYEVVMYLAHRLHGDEKRTNKLAIPLGAPVLAIMLMYLIGIPHGYFIGVNDDNSYYYAKLYILPVAIMLVYVVAAFVMAFIYRIRNKTGKHTALWLYLIPIAACGVIPFLLGGISLTAISLAVILAFMHMGTMNEAFFSKD